MVYARNFFHSVTSEDGSSSASFGAGSAGAPPQIAPRFVETLKLRGDFLDRCRLLRWSDDVFKFWACCDLPECNPVPITSLLDDGSRAVLLEMLGRAGDGEGSELTERDVLKVVYKLKDELNDGGCAMDAIRVTDFTEELTRHYKHGNAETTVAPGKPRLLDYYPQWSNAESEFRQLLVSDLKMILRRLDGSRSSQNSDGP